MEFVRRRFDLFPCVLKSRGESFGSTVLVYGTCGPEGLLNITRDVRDFLLVAPFVYVLFVSLTVEPGNHFSHGFKELWRVTDPRDDVG